MFLVMTLIYKG